MKNIEFIKDDVQNSFVNQSLLRTSETGVAAIFRMHFKKIIIVSSLAGIGLFFTSCMAGYVATEPSYVEYSRPQRSSDLDIWIDGDWEWNRQNQGYTQGRGHWERPVQGRTYVTGSWQTTPRGKTWSKGRWQREGRQRNNENRERNNDKR